MKRSYIIGRDPKAGVRMRDASISRRHARLTIREDGRLHLADLSSTYGTFVHRSGEWRAVSGEIVARDEPVMLGRFRTTLAQVLEIIARDVASDTTGLSTTADRETRKHSVVLMTDVVGYGAMMSADPTGTVQAYRACRRDVIDPSILRHGGRIFKEAGDGVFAAFERATEALRCANDIQMTVPDCLFGRGKKRFEFRIGIHAGEVIKENDDLLGEPVIMAERLQAVASPGRIGISAIVKARLDPELSFQSLDRGELALKSIPEPVQVYEVIPGGIEFVQPAEPARAATPPK
jgi:class 3 adenylate cyclase